MKDVLFCYGGDLGSIVQVAPAVEFLEESGYRVTLCFGEGNEEDRKVMGAYQHTTFEHAVKFTTILYSHYFGKSPTDDKHYLVPNKAENEVQYNFRLVKNALGIAPSDHYTKASLCHANVDLSVLPEVFTLINPSTTNALKNWPYFQELVKAVKNPIVIGPRAVKDAIQWPENVRFFLDKSVAVYGALFKKAQMLVSVESGLAQYAYFLDCPVFMVLGSSSAMRYLHKGMFAIKSSSDCVSCEDWKKTWPNCDKNLQCLTELKPNTVLHHLSENSKKLGLDVVDIDDTRLIQRMKYLAEKDNIDEINMEEEYSPNMEHPALPKALFRTKNSEHWTPLEFKKHLQESYKNVRIECLGGWMLGCCGFDGPVNSMSMTCPVYNEEEWIELVCQSFMGVVDEIVIGIDKKTNDRTEEIVRKYTDNVFFFEFDEEAKKGKLGGFSGARNDCIQRCTKDYIFMTEGHEHLHHDCWDIILGGKLPSDYRVFYVERRVEGASTIKFPWIFKRDPDIRFESASHNMLTTDSKDERGADFQGVYTIHKIRNKEHEKRRFDQRGKMNVKYFTDNIAKGEDVPRSYFYLGSEYMSQQKYELAAEHYIKSYELDDQKDRMYQARINGATCLYFANKPEQCWDVLAPAMQDVWDRNEHYNLLSEICIRMGEYNKAEALAKIACLFNKQPFSTYFVQPESYTYRPYALLLEVYKYTQNTPEAAKVYSILKDRWAAIPEVHAILQGEKKSGNSAQYESFLNKK